MNIKNTNKKQTHNRRKSDDWIFILWLSSVTGLFSTIMSYKYMDRVNDLKDGSYYQDMICKTNHAKSAVSVRDLKKKTIIIQCE